MRPLIFILIATGFRICRALVDLSKPYASKSSTPEGQELIEIAEAEDDIHAFLALECGMIVAEYGDQEAIRHLFSITKSWTGLLMGVAETEGLLTLNETLWDIWPDEAIWETVEDAEDRKNTTLKQILQMTGGYAMPEGYIKDALVDALPFTDNRLGGKDFQDSLTYHPLNTTNIGSYAYIMASNLLSYVIQEKTGMMPEDYAKEKVFPFLGIENGDYEWYVNPDQVSTGFHGLKMTTTALSKLGMLYLQDGMANNETQLVDPSWIERSFTIGDERAPPENKFGYIGWWLGTEPAYVTYGFGGQRLGINTETKRVLAILSDTYLKDAGMDTYEDPKALFPTDQIKEQFVFAGASNIVNSSSSGEPFVCPEPESSVATQGISSSGVSLLFGTLVMAFVYECV